MTEERKEMRKLAAIMFADMLGFSRMMHRNEEKTLRLVDEKDTLIADLVSHHRGRVLKTMGDGTFADFSAATDAVNCAVEIQTQLREYNKKKGPSEQIAIRIGIHVGDVIVRDGDIFGDGVNVAARLEPLSEPGGICLSQAVYQATRSRPGVHPVLVGEVELKNILQKQVIYRIPAFYSSFVDEVPRTLESSSFKFGLDRIERLPPPKRSPLTTTWVLTLGYLATGLTGLFLGALSDDGPYRILPGELVEPTAIVTAFQQRNDDTVKRIWASFDTETRRQIEAFDPRQADTVALEKAVEALRRGLNKEVVSARVIFDDRIVARLDVPEDVRTINRNKTAGNDLRRINRLLLEAAFPGMIQRYAGELPTNEKLNKRLAHLGNEILHPRNRLFLILDIGTVLFFALCVLVGVLCYSLATLRVSFKEIRNVDALLEYFVRDMGFRTPHKKGDSLVFRATWWTILVYNVFRVEAKISGNRVILTGPLLLMRRLEKRLRYFAEGAEGEEPRLNFVVQHLLGLKEALIGCFVAMSFSWSVIEVFGD
jgi:class 3 adenylate cyclase